MPVKAHQLGRAVVLTVLVWLGPLGPGAWPLDKGKALTQYVLENWGTREGLAQRRVGDICRTKDGYLWLATEDGAVRFDGTQFKTFNAINTPELRDNYVFAFLRGAGDELWIGTFGGLTGLNRGVFTAPTAAGTQGVWTLARGGECSLWVAGYQEGLSCLEDGQLRPHPRYAGRRVRALLASGDGSLWVGTADALEHLVGQEATVYTPREGLPRDAVITSLAEGADGALWIGTRQGLGRLAKGALTFYTTRDGLSSDFIHKVLLDRDGSLWLGTSGGLNRFERGRFTALTKREGLTDDSVVSLYEDDEGSLWVGTSIGGLNRLRDGPFTTYGRPEALSTDFVWSVHEARDGSFWVGTRGGVNRLEGGQGAVHPSLQGFPGRDVFSIAGGRDGSLWFGTNAGLVHLRDRRMRTYGPSDGLTSFFVRSILEDSAGRLWAGTAEGGVYRREGERFVPLLPPAGVTRQNAFVPTIFESRDGTLWFGTDAGLWRMRGDGFVAFTTRDGLPGDNVRVLFEEADGTLWVSARPGGLGRLRDGRWTVFGPGIGLLDERVHAAAEDESGNLWFSSDRAIYRVAKAELLAFAEGRIRSVTSLGYDGRDGLRVTEGNGGRPAIWKAADGRLWFATAGGLAVVDPQNLRRNDVPPPVYLEAVMADEAKLVPRDDLRVEAGKRTLEFHYTAPSLRVPERTRFKYRLEGFDAAWIEAGGRRTAYYTNLPPGRYRFRVTASNDDGVWNEAGASLALSVAPRWYQTRAFWGAAAAGLVLIGVASQRLRVRRLKIREKELTGRVQEAVAQIKVLRGLLPICAWCKKIRDDTGYWTQLESFLHDHSYAEFSHGICPDCVKHLAPTRAAGRGSEPGDA